MAARSLLGAAALSLAVSLPVHASVNGGGSIIVHTNDAYTYLTAATVCTTTLGEPASCEDAITRTDKASGAVVWFLAAFVSEAVPEVAAVYFGMQFDDATLDPTVRFGNCSMGTALTIEDPGWPGDMSAGVTLAFVPAMTDHLFRFYYFQVEDRLLGPDPWLCSAINPAGQYAAFYNSSFPPDEDRITRFGCVHWYDDEGFNTCPVPPTPGACCLTDATCRIVSHRGGCEALNGVYQGDGTICDSPCSACCYWDGDPMQRYCVVTTGRDCMTGRWSEIIIPDGWGHELGSVWSGAGADGQGKVCATEPAQAGTMWWCQDPRDQFYEPPGACCFADGHCELRASGSCHGSDLFWLGDITTCWPATVCAIVPVEDVTWGRVKAMFR